MRIGIVSTPPDIHNPATHLGQVAKYLLYSGGHAADAVSLADGHGAPERVRRMLKNVATGQLGDANYGSVLGDWAIASEAFIGSLRARSVFVALLNGGMRRVPLATRLGAMGVSASAYIVGEGQAVPVSSFSLTGSTLPAKKACAIVVTSQEVATSETPGATALINSELQGAVAFAIDGDFFSTAMAGAPSYVSSGTNDAAMKDDLRSLLNAVNVTGGGSLMWAASPDVGNALSLMDTRGTMSPQGGEFIGLPAIVTDAVPAGTLRLINGAGFAGDTGGTELSIATQADVDMQTAPDSPATASTVRISLWQNNLRAIKAFQLFGVQKVRSDAIAELTGITWGDSP